MNTIDPQKAARVWQRVQQSAPATPSAPAPQAIDTEALQQMILQEWTDAATYLHLSRRLNGPQRAALYRMFQEEQTHAACLKGIYTLTTGSHPKIRTTPLEQENTVVLLRRCYGREMRALAQYEARSSDPEYGHIFSRLAAQEREHCKTILQLLGSIPLR